MKKTNKNNNSKKPNGRLSGKFYYANFSLPTDTEIKIIYIKNDNEKHTIALAFVPNDLNVIAILQNKIDGLPENLLLCVNKNDIQNKTMAVNDIVKLKKSNKAFAQFPYGVEYPIEIVQKLTSRAKTILNLTDIELKNRSNDFLNMWRDVVISRLTRLYIRRVKNLAEKNKEIMPKDIYNLLIQHIKKIDMPNGK